MVNYTYKSIEDQHDNMPNWYRPEIDSKDLKSLMKRRNLPVLLIIFATCFYYLLQDTLHIYMGYLVGNSSFLVYGNIFPFLMQDGTNLFIDQYFTLDGLMIFSIKYLV